MPNPLFNSARRALDRALSSPAEDRSPLARLLLRSARLVALVQRRFRADLCLERAAALAFSTVVAAIPALIIILLTVQLVRGSEPEVDLLRPLIERIAEWAPVEQRTEVEGALFAVLGDLRLEERLSSIVLDLRSQAGPVAAISLLVLLLSAMTVFRSAERAFTGIWRVERRRGLFEKIATFWLLLTAAPAALGLSAYLKGQLLAQWGSEGSAGGGRLPLLEGLFPVAVSFLAFLLLMAYLPNTRVRLRSAAAGALTAALGWEIGTHLLRIYVESTLLSGLLGALGVVPFFLLFVLFSWSVVLVGAETAYCLQHFRGLEEETWGRSDSVRVSRPVLALRLMERVYRCFRGDLPGEDLDQLASALSVPIAEVEGVLHPLVESGLLVSRGGHWIPGRDAAQLGPAEVLAVLPEGWGLPIPASDDPMTPLAALLSEVDSAANSRLSQHSFADLLGEK